MAAPRFPPPKAVKVVRTTPKFRLVQSENNPEIKGIQCLGCGRTSWNAYDVKHEYCGKCHKFHDEKSHAEVNLKDRNKVT